jgi:uncharacterized protein (TIGR03067 family)
MLSRKLIAGLALLGLTAITPAAPAPKYRTPATAEQLKKLQGEWVLSSSVRSNLTAAAVNAAVAQRALVLNRTGRAETRIRIDGDTWSNVHTLNGEERVTTAYRMKLDASKKPVWLDLVRDGTGMTTMQGILLIEGDTVKFCYRRSAGGAPVGRPTSFHPDDGCYVMTLQRVARP